MPPHGRVRYVHPYGCDNCGQKRDDLETLDGVVYCEECKAQIGVAKMIAKNHADRVEELRKKGKLVQIKRTVELVPWTE